LIELLNSDEQPLVEAARAFAREQLLDLDRRCDRDETSICTALPQLAQMGFMALRLPEEYGGLQCRRLLYAAILHELAYASPSVSVTLSVHNMVGELLLRFAGERVKSEVLPVWGQAENHWPHATAINGSSTDPKCGSPADRRGRGSSCWRRRADSATKTACA
jgi:alkylation response protein AidB-like acyl-CoA dehydrogenase